MARYAVEHIINHKYDTADLIIVDNHDDPIHSDDCPAVNVFTDDELRAAYVERPAWHEHDDFATGFHDHDGAAVHHEHRASGAVYFESDFFRASDVQRAPAAVSTVDGADPAGQLPTGDATV